MKKKFLFILLGVIGFAVFVFLLIQNGVITFQSFHSDETITKNSNSVDRLTEGNYYVWHNEKSNDIQTDLSGEVDSDVFRICPAGDSNQSKDSFVRKTRWFTSENDMEIPTVFPGDKLLFISSDQIPFKGIKWERYTDNGYTIGAANMIEDESGHYHITSEDGKSFKGYVYEKSDAYELNRYVGVMDLFLDKVGGTPIRKNSVSDGGTVLNLKKDKEYVCEWYSGTYYQDYKMKANIHAFSLLEEFETHDYEFLHSNVIEITIPEWFKTGYYYVNNIGMVRYVTDEYASIYNREPYDPKVFWNDPIILYDEYGNLVYDPSTGTDHRNDVAHGSTHKRKSGNSVESENPYEDEIISQQPDSDVGAEMYETNNDVEFTGATRQ